MLVNRFAISTESIKPAIASTEANENYFTTEGKLTFATEKFHSRIESSSSNQNYSTLNRNATADYTQEDETFSKSELMFLITARYTTIALCILSFYLLVAAVTYEIRKRDNNAKKILGFLIIGAAAAAFFSCCWQLSELWNCCIVSCYALKWIYSFAYVINSSFIYTVIWFHQRKLYSDPRLSESKNKLLKILNVAVLVAIQLVIILVVGGLVSGYTLQETTFGCVLQWEDGRLYTVLIPVTAASMTFSTLFRVALLLLIVYPLLKRIKGIDLNTTIKYKMDISKDIQDLVNRLGLCNLVALIMKILLDTLSLLEALGDIDVFVSNLRVLELISQSFLITFTFANWKQRLFPFVNHDSQISISY